jgi:hypothetical protein
LFFDGVVHGAVWCGSLVSAAEVAADA